MRQHPAPSLLVACLALMLLVTLPHTAVSAPATPKTEAPPETLTIEKIVKNTDDFTAYRDRIAGTPEGGAAVFILAMMVYAENAALGDQCFTIALDRTQIVKGSTADYKGYRPARSFEYFSRRIGSHPYLPFAYVVGTKPDDGYKATPPYILRFSRNRYSVARNGDIKVFVGTAGGVRPRPISLRKNDRGHWKVVEASSLFVGVAAPKRKAEDEL